MAGAMLVTPARRTQEVSAPMPNQHTNHPVSIEDRFWAKVNKDGPIITRDDRWPTNAPDPPGTPCWVWTGALNNGYSWFSVDGHPTHGFRWAYEQEHGPIPDGLEPDHLCRNRPCVLHAHLELVTRAINVRRGNIGRAWNERQKAIVRCPHGHEYTPANTYIWRGGRHCRSCRISVNTRTTERRRAARG